LQAGVAALAEEGASRLTPFGSLGGTAAGVAANKLVAPDAERPNSKIPADLKLASGYSVKISAGDFVGVAKDTEKLSCNGKEAPLDIKAWYYDPFDRDKNKAVFCKTHAQSDATDAKAVTGNSGYETKIRNGDFIGVAQPPDDSDSEEEEGESADGEAEGIAEDDNPVADPAAAAQQQAEGIADPFADPANVANPLPRAVTEATAQNADSLLQIIRTRFGDGAAKIGSAATYVTNLVRETLFDKLKANLVLAATGAAATASVGFALWYYGPALLELMGDPMAFLGWSFTSAQSAALNATQTVESALNASMNTMASNSTDAQFAKFVEKLVENATSAATNATGAATAAVNATAQAAAGNFTDFVGVNATEPVAAAANITNATTPITTEVVQTLRANRAVYTAFVRQLAAKFAVQPAPLKAAITAVTVASQNFNIQAILASAKAQAEASARALSDLSIASFKQLQSMHKLLFPILKSFERLLEKSKALVVPTNVLSAFGGLGRALTVQNPPSLQSFDTRVLEAMRNVQQTNGTATVSPETIRRSQDELGKNVTTIEDFPWDHPNMNWGGGGPGDDPGPNFELIDDEESSTEERLRDHFRQIEIAGFSLAGLLPEASWEELFARGTEMLSKQVTSDVGVIAGQMHSAVVQGVQNQAAGAGAAIVTGTFTEEGI
jgi:hypothetical protein